MSEYEAATILARAASAALPGINDSSQIFLYIFCNVQCFGQRPQDIDLLILFFDNRPSDQLQRTSEGAAIHSFCATVEVKSHGPDSVWFEGQNCLVRYNNRPHNVTSQSEAQKYSVRNYIQRNTERGRAPWINNLIWLTNVAPSSLPRGDGNLLGSNI